MTAWSAFLLTVVVAFLALSLAGGDERDKEKRVITRRELEELQRRAREDEDKGGGGK